MARSLKKGPYIDHNIAKKITELNAQNQKKVLKTWARACTITPDFIGHTFAVHNGNKFIPVFVSDGMIGHKLGSLLQQDLLEVIQEIRDSFY